MKKWTQEEVDQITPDQYGVRRFPTGDYSGIKSFGEWCSFGEGCRFGEVCSFGEWCGFGEWCSFEAGVAALASIAALARFAALASIAALASVAVLKQGVYQTGDTSQLIGSAQNREKPIFSKETRASLFGQGVGLAL